MPTPRLTKQLAKDVQPEFVSVDQAEIMTGISRWTWRAYAYQGRVESCKVGPGSSRHQRLLIPIREIRRVIAEGTRPRVAEDVRPREEART